MSIFKGVISEFGTLKIWRHSGSGAEMTGCKVEEYTLTEAMLIHTVARDNLE